MRKQNVGAALVAALLAAFAAVPAGAEQSTRSAAELMDAVMWNREPIGGAFTLSDQAGSARTDADFRGRLLLVYFGFTTCPDICPTDLQEITLALDALGADGDVVQPLFVTLDPTRDTPAHLAEYVKGFHPRLVALTGSADSIQATAAAYRVYHRRVVTGPKPDDYTIDHSAFIYLIGRDGQYLGFFPPGTPADRMTGMIRASLGNTPLR